MIVPCYRQEFWYSCFATCVKMILEYYGIRKSERDLRVLLKTTPRFGTFWPIPAKEIKHIGFELIWKKFWSLEEISSIIRQSIPIIVGVQGKTDIDKHAVVLLEVSEENVTVADPDNGELVKIRMTKFLEMWNERDGIAGYLKKIN